MTPRIVQHFTASPIHSSRGHIGGASYFRGSASCPPRGVSTAPNTRCAELVTGQVIAHGAGLPRVPCANLTDQQRNRIGTDFQALQECNLGESNEKGQLVTGVTPVLVVISHENNPTK